MKKWNVYSMVGRYLRTIDAPSVEAAMKIAKDITTSPMISPYIDEPVQPKAWW